MTDDELAAIEDRACWVDSTEDVGVIMASAKDVPALADEVKRLRAARHHFRKWIDKAIAKNERLTEYLRVVADGLSPSPPDAPRT